jgi:methyl-accepting chemotaxis protein
MFMFFSGKDQNQSHLSKGIYDAISRSQAVIEFDTAGMILFANDNFLSAMGYTAEEVIGKHHSMFVDSDYAKSEEYRAFWEKLRRGEFDAKEYKRYGKGGKEVWIQASYNPIIDAKGQIVKIVKFATEITKQKLNAADTTGQISAISKSQAVIEFNMDGTIIDANQNFLSVMGYTLPEIQGKHHSMFAEPDYAKSEEYRLFWERLRAGQFDVGEYKRVGKNGKEVWIHASYNPILDMNGKPFKVVKYASDVTAQKLRNADYTGQIDAINKVQAVIQFNLDGTIITANNAFLRLMEYSLDEVAGRHHRIFVDSTTAKSDEYAQFWENLRQGQFESKVYKRYTKSGREVWIQASYNPIFDMNGKPFKVVKYANDITEMVSLTDETGQNIQSVAAATEQLAASIHEINSNMDLSEKAAKDIMVRTQEAGQSSEQLVKTTESMENIVRLIRDIAEQVNLLALNATIEAARAGDAGKGFAVVASEVKNLAMQTSSATNDIEKEISSVQGISTTVADSIKEIVGVASNVCSYVTNVAGALQQQSVATQDISANSQKTLVAVTEITNQIKKIAA